MNIKAMAAGSAAIAGALATVAMATAAVSQAEVHGNRGDRDVVALVLDLRDEGLNLTAEKAARFAQATCDGRAAGLSRTDMANVLLTIDPSQNPGQAMSAVSSSTWHFCPRS